MTTNNDIQEDVIHAELSEKALANDIVKWLDASPVSFAITESLARGRANAVMHTQQTAQNNGHSLSLLGQFSGYLNQHRLVSSISFASLVLFTFLLVQQLDQQSLQNSDAFLLASDLPPEAFADKGFDSWIEAKAQF